MTFYYLTTEDVIDLYVTHVGPREQLLRPDLLDSAVALPQATMFGEDLYPHVFSKAAAMLRSIAQNQTFVDGNSASRGSRLGYSSQQTASMCALPLRMASNS